MTEREIKLSKMTLEELKEVYLKICLSNKKECFIDLLWLTLELLKRLNKE